MSQSSSPQSAPQQNLDNQEVNNFSKLAAKWWDTNGPLKTLHQMNPLRLDFIRKHVGATNMRRARCLDIGCGAGILSEELARHTTQVTALDASADVITVAQQHAQSASLDIDYQACCLEEYASDCELRFEIITCMELLEHVPDPASIIQHAAQLLAPGGKLFISTLNRNLKSFLLNIIAAEYITGIVPRGTHDYKHFITPPEIANWARDVGLNTKDLRGIKYNPLSGTFRLHQGTCTHYIMCLCKLSI